MAIARRCAGCGATLQDPEAGRTSITCRFCGLTHDLTGAASGPRPVVIEIGPAVRQTGKAIKTLVWSILALVALVTVVGLYVAYRTMDAARSFVDRATTTAQQSPAPPRLLTPTELGPSTAPGWQMLEVPPAPGGVDAFDPVAALPWAMDIANAWASDAVLTRIDVGRVDATGLVALDGEATSGFRFSSPGRQARWKQETDAGSKSVTRTGMMLQLQGTAVRALLEEGRRGDDRLPPAAISLPLPEVLVRARKGRGFQDRPFYSGYMIHLPREGWVWYFQSPSGDSFPRVRARDGQTYPY